jgi:hypothetical protein
MASKNVLLGSGDVVEEELSAAPIFAAVPAWRYHPSKVDDNGFPVGELVKSETRLAELNAAGWKDHPGKVKLLPGHEKVWEEEQGGKEAAEVDWPSLTSTPDIKTKIDLSVKKTRKK